MPFDGPGFDNRVRKIDAVMQLIGAPDKWVKGKRRTNDGRFCVNGALIERSAANLSPLILQAANQVTGKSYGCLEAFNDEAETTHPLLIRVLARARADLIEQAAPVPSSSREHTNAATGLFASSTAVAP
jgi:hypothetical protein